MFSLFSTVTYNFLKYIKFSFKIYSKFTLIIGHNYCATTFALYINDNGLSLTGGAIGINNQYSY